jgi:site-specific recombinase XerD
MKHESRWAITGEQLAELLRATRELFLQTLQLRRLSKEYLRQSRRITDEYAAFCAAEQEAAHPWQLRQKFLAHLAHQAELRSQRPFSASYLDEHSRQLRYFLRWYKRQVVAGKVSLGELSVAQLEEYWTTQRRALLYRHKILRGHLRSLLSFLQQRSEAELSGDFVLLLRDYFEVRRSAIHGKGCSFRSNHYAKVVTRRHLVWLELQGHLPDGTAPTATSRMIEWISSGEEALRHYIVANVDPKLPHGLYQPLLDYLDKLTHESRVHEDRIKRIFRTNLALCHHLAQAGHTSFSQLRVPHLDEVVLSLLSAPHHDLLRRRQQVQRQHSKLRGFLRYLHQRDLVGRDLASALVSPPCYRACKPPTVLSEEQVQSLISSVNRGSARGRRCYAILLLMAIYGLRPSDVSRLRLNDLYWREGRIALVQNKTGCALTLPLMPQVLAALYDYLRQDRIPGLYHRQVFVSLCWPHEPLSAKAIRCSVSRALREAGLPSALPKDLRTSVATHLLRQGEALSTIQEVLGHRKIETTQRYAVTDVELLRQVLEESER